MGSLSFLFGRGLAASGTTDHSQDRAVAIPADASAPTAAKAWSVADFAAVFALAAIGLLTNLSTVLNNAYSFGSTLYDSAIFQTIIWRSGWDLKPAPTVDDISFLNTHLSLINYLPSALSYLLPVDRITYYGLVYGLVYACLAATGFILCRPLFSGRTIIAAALTLAFYISGPVLSGQWEPHQEIASALFILLFFFAWARERNRLALVALCLNALVREDCGLLLAFPLFLLALGARLPLRGNTLEIPTNALRYACISALLSILGFAAQKTFFHQREILSIYYSSNSFNNFTWPVIAARLLHIFEHSQFLWMPGVVLITAAVMLRDWRLGVGWLAVIPFWAFNFFSDMDLSTYLGSYKCFPLIPVMLWPAIVALRSEAGERQKLRWVQVVVLLSSILTWENGGPRLLAPDDPPSLMDRWLLHPETEHAAAYRSVEARIDLAELGNVKGTVGVLALYPYSFPIWYKSSISDQAAEGAKSIDSLLWFSGDRDDNFTKAWLSAGGFPYQFNIAGTKMHLATRYPFEHFRVLGPLLSPGAP